MAVGTETWRCASILAVNCGGGGGGSDDDAATDCGTFGVVRHVTVSGVACQLELGSLIVEEYFQSV